MQALVGLPITALVGLLMPDLEALVTQVLVDPDMTDPAGHSILVRGVPCTEVREDGLMTVRVALPILVQEGLATQEQEGRVTLVREVAVTVLQFAGSSRLGS